MVLESSRLSDNIDHAIDILENKIPLCCPTYYHSEKELELLKTYLKDIEAQQFIYRSSSSATLPILFILKKDTTELQLCVNYHALNKIKIKNRYPILFIDFLLDWLYGTKYFTKINLWEAFHLLWIKKGDEWKTTFYTPFGLY